MNGFIILIDMQSSMRICRDLDEVLSKKMADVDFDAEIPTLPPPPIVSSYMIVEVQLLLSSLPLFPLVARMFATLFIYTSNDYL